MFSKHHFLKELRKYVFPKTTTKQPCFQNTFQQVTPLAGLAAPTTAGVVGLPDLGQLRGVPYYGL